MGNWIREDADASNLTPNPFFRASREGEPDDSSVASEAGRRWAVICWIAGTHLRANRESG
jgi:hypothetical protein